MRKSLILISLSVVLFSFYGCQDILECVINRKPVLSDTGINTAQLNANFFAKITGEIKNEPRDNAYFYYYDVVGDLPDGLDVFFDYRDVIIEGVPRAKGRYRFTVNLEVEQVDDYCENDLNDCDGLCERLTSKTYILTVD